MPETITSNDKGYNYATKEDVTRVNLESKLELSEYKREIENKLSDGLKATSKDLADQFARQVSATKVQTRWIIGTFITIIGLILSLIGIIITIWLRK